MRTSGFPIPYPSGDVALTGRQRQQTPSGRSGSSRVC